MNHTEGTVPSDDGTALYWQRLEPETAPRAKLLFIHGLAEHSGRYRHVVGALRSSLIRLLGRRLPLPRQEPRSEGARRSV